ncbi:EF-hand domain-containing protein [Sphingomonas sp. H160509]|uniref:EF-hand domain-containing protein n=1 Tax=Sphingomonas sp. H160509 TaxID=2955313 RepID=UPI002097E1BF|nr:EF-hand domain-containing protein [Sphingomonas sp. H160509]MDD1451657.1 EF-hand domain-containing protein [Sphingomonas sp. H160509]
MARTTDPPLFAPQILWSLPTVLRQSLTLLVLAGLATPALAQETRASASAKFKAEFAASDTNKDGVLTRAEVQARIGNMKVGGQGRPDPVHAKRLADLWFTSADKNKDGKVTQAEAQALLAATFAKYDANHDGKIGGDERAAAKADVQGPR